MKVGVYLFSFNRGVFLQNCISSLEECAPELPITIIDDNSTDKNTLVVLKNLSGRYSIIRNNPTVMKEKKTGGLYTNMNIAMQEAKKKRFEYVLFIQDDMQLVRYFRRDDITKIKNYFKHNDNTIQINTSFIKRRYKDRFENRTFIDESKTAYLLEEKYEEGKSNFAATGVFKVSKFFNVFHKFEVGELANSEKARKLGLVLGRSIYPFMNWLPSPISYREKRRDFIHKTIEKIGGAGFYPILKMTDNEVEIFLNRSQKDLPIMEKFLKSPDSPHEDIWSMGGGLYHVTGRGGLIEKCMLSLKKIKKLF